MICEHCGQENGLGTARCGGCGRALGSPSRDEPGDRVPPPSRERRAERRQVTALFCDIVGSVTLTLRLGPEDMMQVVDIYFAACDRVVAEHGGHIINYMGDGVLVYFGYPRANEDDAANAVRAGMALREAARKLDLPSGVTLQTRVGIATGLVVVSDLMGRGMGRDADIVGETPNLAARLQSVAPPDGIVVSAATRRITRGLFTYRDLGSFTLKGFAQPVEAFEPVEATAVASRFLARTAGEATPLVGRDRELALLIDGWTAARAGAGKAVLLQGEPGIGKSRLVDELRRHVADGPHAQITWDCGPHYSDSALHPVCEQLARAAGFERGDGAPARRDKLEQLLARIGVTEARSQAVLADLLAIPPDNSAPAETLTPDKRKEVILDTLLAMMEQLASSRPTLFVVEDLHWSDSTTLELLDRAIRRAGDRRWLILLTARPEFESLRSGEGDLVQIQLGRLDLGNAERICAHLGVEGLLPAALVGQIIARCDGIPLFVEEMTKSVLEGMAAAPVADGKPAVAVPESLQDSLVARLDRLGAARRIANLGAVIGRRFHYELLSSVATQPEPELRHALRDLTLSGLVEGNGLPPASVYRFKHALMRDAAYDSLFTRERQKLHGQIAAALRDRFPETQETEPELLAYHLTESGATAEAIPLWAAAGQRAASCAAHVEAVGHLQTALDLLRQQPADGARAAAELPLLIGLAVSLAASRGYSVPEVGKVLAEARAICDALGNAAGLFAVLRGICSFSTVAGDLVTAEEMARRCVEIGEQTGLAEHRIEGDAALGHILWAKGQLAASRHHLERANRLYAAQNGARLTFPSPQDPLVANLAVLPLVLHAMGDAVGAEQALRELVDHARSLDQSYDLAYALSWHASFDILSANYAGALPAAEEALRLCETHGYATWAAVASALRAAALGHLGEPQHAIDLMTGAIAEFTRLGITHVRGFHMGELAGLQAAAGDTLTALSTIDAAIAFSRRSGDCYFLSPLLRRRAAILARSPGTDPVAITAVLREAVTIAEAQGAPAFARQSATSVIRADAAPAIQPS